MSGDGRTVEVTLDRHRYAVHVEAGALTRAGRHLAPYFRNGRALVVTDPNVARHWLPTLTAALAAEAIVVDAIEVPAGDAAKCWAELERLTDWLLDRGVERGHHIIALGGGAVGDLTGFAASIVKRGCRFVQIPTTLLAQVDSSVGGKTAINTRAGKNLVGAFHQPDFVLADPALLATLPPRELAAGYAEVVKYGLIDDPDFFAWCEAHGPALLAGDLDLRAEAVARSVAAKARVVAADETERTGTRALLNLGHTFGHSLEAEAGFSDRLLHGEAVAAGMALAFRFSVEQGLCEAEDARRAAAALAAAGLPVSPSQAGVDADGGRLVAHMLHDKKMEGGRLPFLLARGIGRTFLARDVALADVAAFLDRERSAEPA